MLSKSVHYAFSKKSKLISKLEGNDHKKERQGTASNPHEGVMFQYRDIGGHYDTLPELDDGSRNTTDGSNETRHQ